nr:hypothetical protein [Deltaproteobacteria bacterium]
EYDDDIAYLALERRVLDIGDLVEPFSFRRLSAYGGHIVLQALTSARGSTVNVNVLDKSLCFVLVVLLLAGYARQRRVPALWLGLVALVVALFPDVAINTASQWSGVALMLALYRTLVPVDREAGPAHFAIAGLVGAATCTLRQNYIIVVVLFLAIVLGIRLVAARRSATWRAAVHRERTRWIAAVGFGLLGLVGWWIAAYASNRTFLFPIIQGTWNHALTLDPTAATWVSELGFFVQCCIESQYLHLVPVLWVILVFVKDTRAGRPLTALFVAGVLGFAFLIHSFASSDPRTIWRYGFAFSLPLFALLALEVASEESENPVRLGALGRWIVLASVLLQLALTREEISRQFTVMFTDLRHAMAIDRAGDPVARNERSRYRAMQAAVPEGARVVAMLDDAQYLDYRRNTIMNLDAPGYASPGPQLPMFLGGEALRAYFIGQGIHHLAFVRPDHSRYLYRREIWISRMFTDIELFQINAAYQVAMIDGLMEIAMAGRIVYDADGLVVVDLGTTSPSVPLTTASEGARRRAFVRGIAEAEQLHDAWTLTMRDDVIFEDGLSGTAIVVNETDPKWFEVVADPPATPTATRGLFTRWMHRRAHVRLRGSGHPMRLAIRGRLKLNEVFTRPWIDLSLDGATLATGRVDATGAFAIEVTVPAMPASEWGDLYIVLGSVSEPWRDVRTLHVAGLELLEWEPR